MSYPKDELPAPETAHEDSQAFELLRLWFAEGAPRVSVRMELWTDPVAWGFMLGEVARNLAGRYSSEADVDPALTLARIRAGFTEEVGAADGAVTMDEVPEGLRSGSTAD